MTGRSSFNPIYECTFVGTDDKEYLVKIEYKYHVDNDSIGWYDVGQYHKGQDYIEIDDVVNVTAYDEDDNEHDWTDEEEAKKYGFDIDDYMDDLEEDAENIEKNDY